MFKQIVKSLVKLHESAPHMSSKSRRWIADNAWRLDIIGAGLTIYGLFVLVPYIITALVLSPSAGVIGPSIPYYQELSGFLWIVLVAVAIVFLVTLVLLVLAVLPLLEMRRKGWDLMFLAYTLNVVLGVVTTILYPSILEFAALIIVGLGAGYLLLEVRSEFSPQKSAAKIKS